MMEAKRSMLLPAVQLNFKEVWVLGTGSNVKVEACVSDCAWAIHEIKNNEIKRVKILFIGVEY